MFDTAASGTGFRGPSGPCDAESYAEIDRGSQEKGQSDWERS